MHVARNNFSPDALTNERIATKIMTMTIKFERSIDDEAGFRNPGKDKDILMYS